MVNAIEQGGPVPGAETPGADYPPVGLGEAVRCCLALALAWVPALVGSDTIAAVADLDYPAGAAAYFVPDQALTLYLWAPLVVLSAVVLFLSPGLLLALALNAGKTVGQWLVFGFGLSLALLCLAGTGLQVAVPGPVRGPAFAGFVAACSLPGLALLLVRAARGSLRDWPFRAPNALAQLLSVGLVSWLLLVALAPKVYWENFSGDGAHAYEAGRLLLHQASPFWPVAAGDVASYPGLNTVLVSYPTSWFIRLFGDLEASARLPFFLFVPPLYGGLLAVIGAGRARVLGLAESWLVWLPLVTYFVVMAFSATYSPYSADLGLPTAQFTLLPACFFGVVLASLRREPGWLALLTVLTATAAPNGILLVALWLGANALLGPARPWRDVATGAACLVGALVLLSGLVAALKVLGQPTPGDEHGLTNLLKRLAFLRFDAWYRVAYLVVPCGIVPALALFAWRAQDRVARLFTVITVTYFGFFYIQAHTALYYYSPTMLLPVVVFWRSRWVLEPGPRPWALGAVGVAGVVALVLSLPRELQVYAAARPLGTAVEDVAGGYERSAPAAFKRIDLLTAIVPVDGDRTVPEERYGESPLVLFYYAHRHAMSGRAVNYVLQASAAPPPHGMELLADREGTALYVRDRAAMARHQAVRPPAFTGCPLYHIPRRTLFRWYAPEEDHSLVRVEDVLARLGVNTEWLKTKATGR